MGTPKKALVDFEARRTDVALFRHGLIARFVGAELEPGGLTRELRALARRRYKIPWSARTRVSLSSLRRWLDTYRKGGFEALKPGLRSDHGQSRAIPREWLEKAMALRSELPSRTSRCIVEILKTLPDCPKINAHTLSRLFRRLNMTRKQLRKATSRTKRWAAKNVNDIWQGDATPGLWLPHPTVAGKSIQTTLFLWIDDKSRLVPHAEFFYDAKLPRMERTLRQAVLARGVPKRVYTDNGNVYVARQFKAALAELGIAWSHSKVRRPQGRGKIERIFQTIQADFYPEAKKANFQTLAELNEALRAWIEQVYHHRVHSETKTTPLAAYREGIQNVEAADAGSVAHAFLWRYVRRVSPNGYISLLSNSYSVDPTWASRTLELRCDPFDLSRIEVYQECRPIAKASVRKMKRTHCLDIEYLVPPPDLAPSGIDYLEILTREHRKQVVAEIGVLSFSRALESKEESR